MSIENEVKKHTVAVEVLTIAIQDLATSIKELTAPPSDLILDTVADLKALEGLTDGPGQPELPAAVVAAPVQQVQQPVVQQPVVQQPVVQQPVVQQPVVQQPVVQQPVVQQPVIPQPGPVGADDLSNEGINAVLVAESGRLGPAGSSKIVAVLNAHGGGRVSEIPPANRESLVRTVRALV